MLGLTKKTHYDKMARWDLGRRMVDTQQTVQWSKALLVILAAIALLVAPLASARAIPCQDHAGHATVKESPQLVTLGGHSGLQHARHAVEHKACCANACGVCAVVIDTADTAGLDPTATSQHYELGDQLSSGLAFPPALDPPRFPA